MKFAPSSINQMNELQRHRSNLARRETGLPCITGKKNSAAPPPPLKRSHLPRARQDGQEARPQVGAREAVEVRRPAEAEVDVALRGGAGGGEGVPGLPDHHPVAVAKTGRRLIQEAGKSAGLERRLTCVQNTIMTHVEL